MSNSPPPSVTPRLAWLDLFRGACVLGMIETHVLNTFLAGPFREMSWFGWLTYFDGLIAPAFLFIAGYAQGLGMRQADGVRRGWGRKVRRLGAVWLLGYALHFPAPQLFAGRWSEAWRLGTQVDVLPCLAVSLALLLAIERWMPRRVDFGALVLLSVAVFGAEPAFHWRFNPGFLQAYLNHGTGSLFPLLPWTGFVCAGFLASGYVRESGVETETADILPTARIELTVLKAVVGIVLAFFVLPQVLSGEAAFFFQILTWLLVVVPLVQWVAGRWQPAWLLFVGRESLVIYAAHLLLIELLASVTLRRGGYGPVTCVWIFAAVLGVSLLIAVLWDRARRAGRRPGSSAPAR